MRFSGFVVLLLIFVLGVYTGSKGWLGIPGYLPGM